MKPEYYKTDKAKIEALTEFDVLDFAMLRGWSFNRGTAIKYLDRAGKKIYDGLTAEESEIADLKKAIENINREIIFKHGKSNTGFRKEDSK